MSLLILNQSEKIQQLAQKIFARQFRQDSKMHTEYDERRKRLMLTDIIYNLECLENAAKFKSADIFLDNALWIYKLLVYRMPDIEPGRIKQQMAGHYEAILTVIREEYSEEVVKPAEQILLAAMEMTYAAVGENLQAEAFPVKETEYIRRQYLDLLLQSRIKEAGMLIEEAVEKGIALQDIYLEILQKAMYEIGDLWHKNKITVAKEHYFTAATQGIMAQLYKYIFTTPRRGCSILACCVGEELHEMGIRMLCDLFESEGWDSIYLGAALPVEGVIHAVQEHKPDLIALSVTMPHHLETCYRIVGELHKESDQKQKITRVAVGGRAFSLAPDLWREWGVDISASDAKQLLDWANREICSH